MSAELDEALRLARDSASATLAEKAQVYALISIARSLETLAETESRAVYG